MVELMIVIGIIGMLSFVGGVSLYEASSRNDVMNCAKRVVATIKQARRLAKGGTETSAIAGDDGNDRVLFITSFEPRGSADNGPADLNGDGVDEFFAMGRAGASGFTTAQELYVSGRGSGASNRDAQCDDGVVFLTESTLSTTLNKVTTSGGRTRVRRFASGSLYFGTDGTLLGFGSANRNLYIEKNGQVARVEVVGLSGITRIYVNKDSYYNCGGGTCAVGSVSSGVYANWQPLQGTL